MDTCLNCGAATCLCPVTGTGLVSIVGDGGESDPFVFHVFCDDVVACVGAMMTNIGFTAGMLATGAVDEHLEADDVAGHAVWVGSDTGLTGPYILYDTREWDGHVNITYEVVGGSPVAIVEGVTQGVDMSNQVIWAIGPDALHGLPNLGSAGDAYDLITYETILPAGAGYVLRGHSATGNIALPETLLYDDIGGPPDAAAVTLVIAVRQLVATDSEARFDFLCFGAASADYFNPQLIMEPAGGFGYPNGSVSPFIGLNNSVGTYADSYYANSSAGADPTDVDNTVWVITLDVATPAAYVWKNGVDMTGAPGWDASSLAIVGAFGDPLMTINTNFGVGGGAGTTPAPGEWGDGVVAGAIYRGVPSPADLVNLQTLYGP